MEFEAAEPRPNSGAGQSDRDGDNRHHSDDFDKSDSAASGHKLQDASAAEKDEFLAAGHRLRLRPIGLALRAVGRFPYALLPADNICRVTLPAFLSIATQRDEVVVAVLAGKPVNVR